MSSLVKKTERPSGYFFGWSDKYYLLGLIGFLLSSLSFGLFLLCATIFSRQEDVVGGLYITLAFGVTSLGLTITANRCFTSAENMSIKAQLYERDEQKEV